eukprot:6921784-Alexandrium_andersonii.AAC.1
MACTSALQSAKAWGRPGSAARPSRRRFPETCPAGIAENLCLARSAPALVPLSPGLATGGARSASAAFSRGVGKSGLRASTAPAT